MVFVNNTVGDVFIFIVIIGGGLGLLTASGYFIYRKWFLRCKQQKVLETRLPEADKLDDSKHLSKISVNNWKSPSPAHITVRRPVVMEQDLKGQLHIKNPSVISKSEQERNLDMIQYGNKVLLIDIACYHDLQQQA